MAPPNPPLADTPPRKSRRAPRRSRGVILFALVFVAIVIGVEALVGDRGVFALLQARRNYAELDAALAAARADNEKLREEQKRLEDDDNAIEELARQNLLLAKPGEMLFIVKDTRGARQTPPPR